MSSGAGLSAARICGTVSAMSDISDLRSRFPALARTGPDGRPPVWADCPGGSQVPDTVIDAIANHLRHGVSNTHGVFPVSRDTDELIAEARRAGSAITGADPGEIVFGQNATSLLFSLSRAFGRTLTPGDEVVVTRLDHDANIRPWIRAAEDAGATVRWVDVRTDDATLDLDSFDAALSDRTRLVAVTLASNAVGTMPPAAELVRRAHAAGALVSLDGVHLAQHRALDLHGLNADILACSPYKFFGPHLGMLAVRRELLERWTPYKVRPADDDAPSRWETGTQNHEAFAGLVAAVGYLSEVGTVYGDAPAGVSSREAVLAAYAAIAAHENELALQFLKGVASIPGLRLYGINDPARVDERTPTFSVTLEGHHPLELSEELGRRGVYTWEGHYYAIELFDRLGINESGGAVRIGFCHYHSAQEVDRVLTELEALALGR
jgi:cysteine desulfurase family protein (TIGR01976 family)